MHKDFVSFRFVLSLLLITILRSVGLYGLWKSRGGGRYDHRISSNSFLSFFFLPHFLDLKRRRGSKLSSRSFLAEPFGLICCNSPALRVSESRKDEEGKERKGKERKGKGRQEKRAGLLVPAFASLAQAQGEAE